MYVYMALHWYNYYLRGLITRMASRNMVLCIAGTLSVKLD